MPFVAERPDGSIVAAARADETDEFRCLECAEPVVLRNAHRRDGDLVRAHFMHPAAGDGCPTGESQAHRWMKAFAYAKARETWPDELVQYEARIRVGTGSTSGENTRNRRADVLIEFSANPSNSMSVEAADGMVIECQYGNESKAIKEGTADYLDKGYHVMWLTPEFFEDPYKYSFASAFYGSPLGCITFSATDRNHNPRFSEDGRIGMAGKLPRQG